MVQDHCSLVEKTTYEPARAVKRWGNATRGHGVHSWGPRGWRITPAQRQEKLPGAGTAGSLLKCVRAPVARSPGGSRCGRRAGTGVGSVGGHCSLAERRVAGAPGPNDSRIQHLAFWLVRRGGNQERGVKEWGLQSRERVLLELRVWDVI